MNHCGVYNFDSMYTTTEELWFDEYEHGGPPWGSNRESYEKHSPHRLAANFKTPMLILIAPLGIITNVALMSLLDSKAQQFAMIWMAIGLGVYFVYSRQKSNLHDQ